MYRNIILGERARKEEKKRALVKMVGEPLILLLIAFPLLLLLILLIGPGLSILLYDTLGLPLLTHFHMAATAYVSPVYG